jgi:hypothetical protein
MPAKGLQHASKTASQRCIEIILDAVIGAARHLLGYLTL